MTSSVKRCSILDTSDIAFSHFMNEVQLSTSRGTMGWVRVSMEEKFTVGFLIWPLLVVMRITPFWAPIP